VVLLVQGLCQAFLLFGALLVALSDLAVKLSMEPFLLALQDLISYEVFLE